MQSLNSLPIREPVVGADVKRIQLALAAGTRISRTPAGAGHIKPFVVRRKREAVRVWNLLLSDDLVHLAARVHAVDAVRQLAAEDAQTCRLP